MNIRKMISKKLEIWCSTPPPTSIVRSARKINMILMRNWNLLRKGMISPSMIGLLRPIPYS